MPPLPETRNLHLLFSISSNLNPHLEPLLLGMPASSIVAKSSEGCRTGAFAKVGPTPRLLVAQPRK